MTTHGTLEVCLAAYRKVDSSHSRQMATFCKVTRDTAADWGVKQLPKGETLNRLQQFLIANGMRLVECDTLSPTIRYLGKLLAFDVLTRTEAMEILHFQGDGDQQLWRSLRGVTTPQRIKNRTVTLELLEREHDELLAMAEEVARERGLIPPLSVSTPEVSTTPKAVRKQHDVVQPIPSTDLGVVIAIAASGFRSLAPLLQMIATRGPEGIDAFRAAVGGADEFHDTLDLLKSFSSRKAREIYQGH